MDENLTAPGSPAPVQPGGEPVVSPAQPANNTPAPQPQPVQPPERVPAPKKRRLWLIAAGLVLIAVISAAAIHFLTVKKPTPAGNSSLTKVSVRLNWLHQAQFAGMYVAKDKGFYRNAGLDVDLKEYQDGLDQNKEVSDQKVDFATTTAPEVISSIDSGYKIKAVAAIEQTNPSIIVSPKSANIKSPADFKGKILGSAGGNQESKALYYTLMASTGLAASQATIKSVDFDIVKDLQTHEADTADPYRTDQTFLLDKAGVAYDVIYPEQYGFDIYGDVVIASDQEITSHPALVQKFVSATLQGWQYALDHQDEALTITARYQNSSYSDAAYEKYILSAYASLIKPTNGQVIGSMQFIPWNRAYQSIKNAGILKTQFDPSTVYTTHFLK